jgi:hypothetical protein
MGTKLLDRSEFRNAVFSRDSHTCVFCTNPAVDAHHILERRLFPDGGYYVNNGASVCEQHHLECEMTTISVEDVRLACNITKPIIPPHLYKDVSYDKWGNVCLPNGSRLKGELFYDESVQNVLDRGGVLDTFTHYVKYSRTWHLPWSPGVTKDDRVMNSLDHLNGRRVIVTEKMDGENTTMYSDYIHARSIDSANHESRNWVKQYWSTFCFDIPPEWRVCGENLYAKHSIKYDKLSSYFLGFSIWNDLNECLSWTETLEWFKLLGIKHVPVLYDGVFDESTIKRCWDEKKYNTQEGYVLRVADKFSYREFTTNVLKFVRAGHVGEDRHHWRMKQIEPNELL